MPIPYEENKVEISGSDNETYERVYHIKPTSKEESGVVDTLDNTMEFISIVFTARCIESDAIRYYSGVNCTYPLGVALIGNEVQYFVATYDMEVSDIWATLTYNKIEENKNA